MPVIPTKGITVYNTVPEKLAELSAKIRAGIYELAVEMQGEAKKDTQERWEKDIGTGKEDRYPGDNPAYGAPMPERIFVESFVTGDGAGITITAKGADILAHEFGMAPQRHVVFGYRNAKSPFLGILPHDILGDQARKWGARFRNRIEKLIWQIRGTE